MAISDNGQRVCEGVVKRILWMQHSETANPQIAEVALRHEPIKDEVRMPD